MNNKILLTGLVLASLATGNVFAQGSNIGIGNTSNGDNGFVLGVENQADSTATSSFTAGYKNHTSGANTLTAGHSNIISNANNLTVGTENTVSGTSSLVSGHKNTNKSNNSLVIGMNNTIEQSTENSLVNGEKHNVSARSSSVSGYENKVDGQYNNVSGYGNIIKENASGVQVSGYGNEVSAKNVLVSGTSNKAHGENAFVGGENAQALGRNTFVFGSNAQANQDYTVAIGTQAISSAHDTITIGNGSEANGVSSVVLGRTNKVNADNTVVVGANNGEIKSAQSAVFGYNNTVKGEKPEQLIFGSNSTTNNQGAIVVGTHGQAIAQDAVAIGNNTLADVQNSVALGTNSTTEEAVSTDSIYINGEKYNFAGAVANSTVSIGANGKAGFSGVQNYKRTLTNVAAGRIDDTSTDAINGSQLNAVINALKFTTVVDGTNTTVTETKNIDGGKEFAVHVNKDLTNMNSVQFNNGVAINNNGINAGNKTITNVTAGQNDTDAVNVSQLNNAKDQLTGRINGLDQRVTINANDIRTAEHTILDHEGRITVLESGVKDLDNKINSTAGNVLNQSKSYTDNQTAKVGANAAALSALHPLDFNADEKWQFSVGFGNYKGKNATALGAFYQPNENVLLSVGTTLGTGENMINTGATVRFGSHSSMTTNKQVAVAKEVQDLKLQLSAISQKYDNLVKNLSAQKAGQDADFEYSDLPKDHWAYDFVKKLSDKGYLNGYPDGTFKGDAKMTRYEFAAALWRAVNNGAIIDAQMAKAIKEFEPELEEVNKIMRYRIDTVAGKDNSVHKTERLRVNKNDDPFTHMKRDDYGTKTYINK
jgi:hypothetical protein|nr:MAG TPA: hypothetical protein [Caudoviricetes sp.]